MSGLEARVLPFSLRLRDGMRAAYGRMNTRSGFIVEVSRPGSSTAGYGEASPAWWVGDESLEVCGSALRASAAALAKLPDAPLACATGISDPDKAALPSGDSPAARHGLTTALLDLYARENETTFAAALGLASGRPGVANARSVHSGGLITAEDTATVERRVRELLAAGYASAKLKVGHADPLRDAVRFSAAVAASAGRIAFRLDANRGWSGAQAEAFLGAVDTSAIQYIEEPLSEADPDGFADLSNRFGIRLALDESITRGEDLEPFARNASAAVLVCKPSRLGGPIATLEIAEKARSLGMDVTMTDSLESFVGRAAVMEIATMIAYEPTVGLAGAALLEEDLCHPPDYHRGPSVALNRTGLFPTEAGAPIFELGRRDATEKLS